MNSVRGIVYNKTLRGVNDAVCPFSFPTKVLIQIGRIASPVRNVVNIYLILAKRWYE